MNLAKIVPAMLTDALIRLFNAFLNVCINAAIKVKMIHIALCLFMPTPFLGQTTHTKVKLLSCLNLLLQQLTSICPWLYIGCDESVP